MAPKPTANPSNVGAIPEHLTWKRDEPGSSSQDDAVQPVSLLTLVNALLRRRWVVAICTLVGLLLGAQSKAFSGWTYTSTTTFIPVASRAPSNLSGLAAQLGIGLQGSDAGQTPQFYLELLSSREILRPVVLSKFTVNTPQGPRTTSLVEWYDLGDKPRAKATTEAIAELRDRMGLGTSLKTGIVTLSVTDKSPAIAHDINRKLLEQVSLFNEARRHQRASAEREFTAAQLAESDAQLRAAERRVREFRELNREFGAPKLTLEHERLQREVQMRQELYTATAQAYQQVKIEELRDAPSISIIEPPEVPVKPNPRGLLKTSILGALVGFSLGALLAFLLEYFRAARSLRPEDGEEFRALMRSFGAELRSPISAWRRRKAVSARSPR